MKFPRLSSYLFFAVVCLVHSSARLLKIRAAEQAPVVLARK